jgi:hypothetical protein
MLRVWDQGESVFRLRNFNIVGFYYLFTALHVSVLGPSSSIHIFHRIYSIDNKQRLLVSSFLHGFFFGPGDAGDMFP